MNIIITNILGFIRASRLPNLLIIAALQFLTASFLLNIPLGIILSLPFISLVACTISIAAAGYIINDYYDQKIDLVNRPNKVVVGILFKRRLAMVSHLILNFSSILIGFWIHPFIGIIIAFSAFCLWFYSNHLRRLPLIGNLIIALLSGMTILIVSVLYFKSTRSAIIYAVFAFIISVIREIIKDMNDVKGQSVFGCSTIPVIWGMQGAKYFIYFFSVLGIGLLCYFLIDEANSTIRYYFLSISPFYLWFLYRTYQADTQNHITILHSIINWLIFSGILSMFFLNE